MDIAYHYMPKIKTHLQNVPPYNRSEFIQIYYVEVCNALNAWKMNSNFETYLYCYVKSVYRKFMSSIKMFKKGIEYELLGEVDINEIDNYYNKNNPEDYYG